MNTIATRRPLWPRLKARCKAWQIDRLIRSYEREEKDLIEVLNSLPDEIDAVQTEIAVLRVQLAIAEKNT